MNTFSMSTSFNISVTPSWITCEHYNFTDEVKTKESIFGKIQRLFQR